MILTYNDKTERFECLSSYNEREIPKAAGFRWSPVARIWSTGSVEIAKKLLRWADIGCRIKLTEQERWANETAEASQAQDADIVIPLPNARRLFAYQRAGVAFMAARPNVLLADEMGLGKTVQAIALANLVLPAKTLIVCPASLKLNWRLEWERWSTSVRHRPPVIIDGRYDERIAERAVWITNYDQLSKWQWLALVEWDLLICDEAHYLKNPDAQRTKLVFGSRARSGHPGQPGIKAKRTLLLTGTPILNRPGELWPWVRRLDPDGLGRNQREFRQNYIDPVEIVDQAEKARGRWLPPLPPDAKAVREAALADLHRRLRSTVMLRRLKADVLADLPSKQRQLIVFDSKIARAALAGERDALEASRKAVDEAKTQRPGQSYREAAMRLQQARTASAAQLAAARRDTALAKLPSVVEEVWNALAETDKIVLFAHHHDVLDRLVAELGAVAVLLDGRTPADRRQELVDQFQSDRRTRVFVGGLRAAGLGLTLTAASLVGFVELDWTPALMTQAEDRCHRIGQRSSVLIKHWVVEGSIDARMAQILISKQAVFDQAIDGKSAGASLFDEVLS